MKRNYLNHSHLAAFLILLLSLVSFTGNAFQPHLKSEMKTAGEVNNDDIQALLKKYEKKIYFTQNKGQFNEKVLFKADFPLGQAIVTKEGVIVGTYSETSVAAREEEGEQIEADIQNGRPWKPLSANLKGHSWMMNFLNRSAAMTITAKDHHADAFNFMNGGKQISNVDNYQEVWYNNVYDKVDVRYYPSEHGTLEYDIVCKPGFDKKNIAIQFDGINQMNINKEGHLVLTTSVGEVDFPAPVVYQKINGVQKDIASRYIIKDKNILSFELGNYDQAQPLIIDPIALRWATWVNTNSSGDNHGHCIWVDPSDGAIYVVARVVGTTDRITVGAFDSTANGNLEMIVGKYLEPATIGGSGTRVWQTYIGGSGDDNPYAMEQGPDGNLYITGYTSSTNFPLIGGNAFIGGAASIDHRAQTTDNIFILKINKAGNSIKSSVIGGNGDDGSFDLRIDDSGNIIICGNTQSTNLLTLLPGSGATNTNNGSIDGIVFKINSDLSSVSWVKNYGGSGIDQPTIMVQDNTNGNIYVGGYTTSTNFPTLTPRQATRTGNKDGFIQKLNAAGSTLWSSYFNSDAGDSTSILCMEFNTTKSQLYFGGITSLLNASNIAAGTYDNGYNGGAQDLFVCRMDTNQNFAGATYLGGSALEVNMMGLNTDLNNDVYVFGYTNSTNFPTTTLPNTALQTSNLGSNDKVFLKLKSDLSTLNFSTYYGGAADDYDPVGERGIKFSNCRIYTIVTSKSNNIPLTQGTLNPTRTSTTPYEPGLVVWANPPDLVNNTINDDQTICAGAVPQDIIGSIPNYSLPTIIRNGATSVYPALASAATYQWQISTDSINWSNITGQSGQNLSGTSIGPLFIKTFFRRVIGGDACVLAGAADQVVTVKIITVTGTVNNVLCNGTGLGSITANSDGQAPFQYVWSNGQTTQTATSLTTGTYTVTVTDNGNCTASASFNVIVNQTPTASINGSSSVCSGNSTQWCAPSGLAGYLWSTGATTQCVTLSSTGNYTVTISAQNGCTASASKSLNINQLPASTITGSGSVCSGSSAQWCAPSGLAGYLWSTGATTQCITVASDGAYSVTVSDLNGCSTSSSKTLTVNPLPNCLITGNGSICSGSSTQWCAPSGAAAYLWSTGATTQCIVASTASTFTVTVTDANGCTSSCNKTLTINQNPSPSITGTLSFCSGSSTQVCAPAGLASYIWSTGATTQCITVNTANSFTVTVSDVNGCSGSASVTTVVNQLPASTITGNGSVCSGSSAQWCAPSGLAGYLWSTGATTQCITVASDGAYSVTVSDLNGCSTSSSKTLTVNPLPSCLITGNGSICSGSSTQWCAPAGAAAYLWSTGATTQCIVASTASTFTVTVTDANGCTSSCNKTLTINQNPSPSITGTLSFCSGSSTQVCAPAGLASYLWNTGATTQCVTVSTANTFTVSVSDANGCSASASVTTVVNQLPASTITGNGSVCSGSSAQWCAPSGLAGYLWSTGATTQCITVASDGAYSVTVSDLNGCSTSSSKTLTVNPLPSCLISGSGSICSGSSTQWCAPAGAAAYLWSTGATTQCIVASTASTFTVTVTDANGCTSSCNKTLTINQIPAPSISGTLSFCSGSSTQLCAPAGLASYLWNTGATTQCITVNTANSFTVTVSDVNGCSGSASVTTVVNQLPASTITGNGSVCSGSSAQWCAPSGLAGYLWSTGATTQCITVASDGAYSVTVSDLNGCSTSSSKTLTVNPLPSAAISGNGSICSGGSTQWCAPSGLAGYLWSTGATTQCVVASAAGTYTVTVTDQNGCTGSATKSLTVNQVATCSITGNDAVCAGKSTQWCAGSGLSSYLWSTGATTQCITLNSANTYSVTTTDNNGCISKCNKTLSVNPLPSCQITGNSSVCSGNSTQWCAPSGLAGYLWSTGATTQCITTSAAGTYTVTTTNENGCTSSCSKTLTVRSLPGCTITGTTSICPGSSTQWCAPAGLASYLWSTGATTQCITVSSAGTYTVTTTNSFGCTSSCNKSLTIKGVPSCLITGSGSVCSGNSTQWCAPAGLAAYLWSTGATTQCITVASAGTYTVTTTNAGGCTSSCNKTLTTNALPSCLISGSTYVCQGKSTQWCAPAGLASYLWSTGATTKCINVSAAGTYTVTTTNNSGCTSSCSQTLTVNPLPSCTISGSNSVCSGSSTQWCAPAGLSGYLWSTGATTQCITVSTAGTYTVTTTNSSGCTSSCNKTLTVKNNPGCAITGLSSVCLGRSTQWCAPAGLAFYLWSTGATTQCITVASAGTYTVTTTNAGGCTSSCNKTLTTNALPSCLISGNTSVCQGKSTQWCAPAGLASYLWSTGATTKCINVSAAGTYTVTTTNNSGCTSSCSQTLTVNPLPSCTISGSNSVCSGSSTQWCAPAGLSGYLWSTGATTQCITVSTAGTYTVTTTNSSGCTSSCNKTLTTNALPSCQISGNGSICQGSSTQWCAPAGLASYLWSTGATTQCITLSSTGTYTVTTTNASGCTSSCSKTLTIGQPTACSFTGNLYLCPEGSTQVCAPAGMTGYIWSTGATTQCITATTADFFTVTVTNGSGCVSICNTKTDIYPLQNCFITGNLNPRAGQTPTLCAPAGMGPYVWSTGATTRCIVVNSNGTYGVTVTGSNGCKNSCSVTVNYSARESSGENTAESEGRIISKAYPNPFSASSTIEFQNTESDSHVLIELYNVEGKKVGTLFNNDIKQGVVYKAECTSEKLLEGVYYYRITSGDEVINKKLIFIRSY